MGSAHRVDDRIATPKDGVLIGNRYKLLEKIGEGGMGEVWGADQSVPIKRRVALKLIKPGMDSRSVLARFEAERQALAVMDHPNIDKVLDAGTTGDSRPYFVMELVKGTPITELADARKLTPTERLELFGPVCHAIQHARKHEEFSLDYDLGAKVNRSRDRVLYDATIRHFGRWCEAFTEASINLANVTRHKPRNVDRDAMLLWIRNRKEAGQSITFSEVCFEN